MSTAPLDSRLRYAASAEQYHHHRPSYPAALLDWIEAETATPPARAADVGCGTGIATRLLAERGFEAVGVDPSEEMLRQARRGGPGRYVRGEAAATGLASGSVDLVVAAQSFHWFEASAALGEFRRILRPHGWCVAFWNLRASDPLFDEYDGLLRRYSAEYSVMLKQDAAPAALRSTPGLVDWREAEFTNSQRLDLEGLRGRAYSSSCVAHGVRDRAAFERALVDVFRRHEHAGRVELRYRTVAVRWRLAGAPVVAAAHGEAREGVGSGRA